MTDKIEIPFKKNIHLKYLGIALFIIGLNFYFFFKVDSLYENPMVMKIPLGIGIIIGGVLLFLTIRVMTKKTGLTIDQQGIIVNGLMSNEKRYKWEELGKIKMSSENVKMIVIEPAEKKIPPKETTNESQSSMVVQTIRDVVINVENLQTTLEKVYRILSDKQKSFK